MTTKDPKIDRSRQVSRNTLVNNVAVSASALVISLSLLFLYSQLIDFVHDYYFLFKIVGASLLVGVNVSAFREMWRRVLDLRRGTHVDVPDEA